MLKINQATANLERLSVKTLTQARILERRDLQRMIVKAPEAFFEEMGNTLVLIGQEIKPSKVVKDAIDLLALDEDVNSVVIELKRAEQKLQLLQALSYAAMLADWGVEDFLTARSGFAQETIQDAEDMISDHIDDIDMLNQNQRIILIAENFDYALLKTAEWLTEKFGLDVRCHRLGYVSDGAAEYLSCICVYPPDEIAKQATARSRRVRTPRDTQDITSWDDVIAKIGNSAEIEFLRNCLARKQVSQETDKVKITDKVDGPVLRFWIKGVRRYGLNTRRARATVLQYVRFDGDKEYWQSILSEPSQVIERKRSVGGALRFFLVTKKDFDQFLEALDGKLQSVEFGEFDTGPEEQ